MPTPRKGETKSKFMSRCVSEVVDEGKTPDQAVAQCSGMFDNRKKTFKAVVCEDGRIRLKAVS